MKKRDKVLFSLLLFMALFILYTVGFYSAMGWQWDALIPYVLGAGGFISAISGGITIAEFFAPRRNQKKKEDEIE